MSRDRAAYMRAYRAKDRSAPSVRVEGPNLGNGDAEVIVEAMAEIARLQDEVARLKRELAGRPSVVMSDLEVQAVRSGFITHSPEPGVRNPYAEFNPAPRKRAK